SGVRAFRVHGDELAGEGFFDGDYILIGAARRSRSSALVLAEANGRSVVRRANAHRWLGPGGKGNPAARIKSGFLGVIRKRGFENPGSGRSETSSGPMALQGGKAAPSKLTMLRGRLGMLESTCAGTHNPRLQKALRNEAAKVRRQLQNEAGAD